MGRVWRDKLEFKIRSMDVRLLCTKTRGDSNYSCIGIWFPAVAETSQFSTVSILRLGPTGV